jgi:hypothetical protein
LFLLDRGRLPLTHPACEVPIIKTPCPKDGSDGCTCTCTPQQLKTSAEYTGMMDVFAADDKDSNPVRKTHLLRLSYWR